VSGVKFGHLIGKKVGEDYLNHKSVK